MYISICKIKHLKHFHQYQVTHKYIDTYIPYGWNISRGEIFEDWQILLNKNFCDLIFEVMPLDISITTLTIILPHVSITM